MMSAMRQTGVKNCQIVSAVHKNAFLIDTLMILIITSSSKPCRSLLRPALGRHCPPSRRLWRPRHLLARTRPCVGALRRRLRWLGRCVRCRSRGDVRALGVGRHGGALVLEDVGSRTRLLRALEWQKKGSEHKEKHVCKEAWLDMHTHVDCSSSNHVLTQATTCAPRQTLDAPGPAWR